MPLHDPYVISGVIYNTDETVLEDAAVKIENLTSGDYVTTSTNAQGEYTLDASDFTSGYTDGDTIYVFANIKNKSEWYKTSIDTANGSEEKDLYLKNFPIRWRPKVASNKSAPKFYVYSYNLTNVDQNNTRYITFEDIAGEELMRVSIQPDETISQSFSPGIFFTGAVRVLEDGTGGLKPVHSGQSQVKRVILSGVIQ